MAIVTKEQLEEELQREDDKIAKSFGKTPLTDNEKSDANVIFKKSYTEHKVVARKPKMAKLPEVKLSKKDLSEFAEWEEEAKSTDGWS